ncbi:hypothetical protein [Aquimarina sp. RZ0]|uniref:hypothetical protein n=1 Tax=Aquimarina sp. RZ0 TaxID=2607730 RepID=UPI0011F16E1D|nr:hypothetical protein [Aquimarina sp. RZ0]KAA1245867.1 hypothetical protein F0000_09925 [Aquimarina sp. RZ0]
MKNTFYTHKWISFLIAIGIPQLLFYILKENTDYKGASAITHTLKVLGFNKHMELGIKSLLFIGVLSFILAEWLFIQYYRSKIEKDITTKKLNTVLKVFCLIESYSIPTPLKRKLKSYYL